MSFLKSPSRAMLRDNAPFAALVALYVLIEIAQPDFLALSTQLGLLADSSTLFIMAAGTTFVVLLGSIDLSLQSIASLASVVVALCLPRYGAWAAVIALAASFAIGLLSGVIQTVLRIPSFIATLAISGIASAAALTLSGTRSIAISDDMRNASLGWTTGTSFGIPHEILLAVAVFAFCWFLHRSTVFGRHTDAIGAGEPAAIASGVRVSVTKCLVFATSSFFAGLAGVVMAGRLERFAHAGQSISVAGYRCGDRRRNGVDRWFGRYRAHVDWGIAGVGGACGHDLCGHQRVCTADRIRRNSDHRGDGGIRPLEGIGYQVSFCAAGSG